MRKIGLASLLYFLGEVKASIGREPFWDGRALALLTIGVLIRLLRAMTGC